MSEITAAQRYYLRQMTLFDFVADEGDTPMSLPEAMTDEDWRIIVANTEKQMDRARKFIDMFNSKGNGRVITFAQILRS